MGLSPQGELWSAGRLCSRGGSPDSSVAAGDQGVTAAASQQASGCLAQGTPVRGPGASPSACLRSCQNALRANGVSGGTLTPVARQQQAASVAAGAGRRGIRVHARAPAGTLCRREGVACAGERAQPGGGVFGWCAGGAEPGSAVTLGAAWARLMARPLQPASCFNDQQGTVQAKPVLAFLPIARLGGRGLLYTQME